MGNQPSHSSSRTASASPSPSSPTAPTTRQRAQSLIHPPSASTPIPTSASGSSPSTPTPSTPAGLVDGGHLSPQNPAGRASSTGENAYSVSIVKSCILEKRLAPFYRGLEDYDETYTDELVIQELAKLRARDDVPDERAMQADREQAASLGGKAKGLIGSWTGAHAALKLTEEERDRREARAYVGAVECPICFLYYPPNINTSRCCQQPICTDCFVQIKRAEANVTHLESEAACCPFCVEAEFGVIYERDLIVKPDTSILPTVASPGSEIDMPDPRSNGETMRRKSVSHKSKEVVTIDQIRPDWEEKLNAVKAAAARRAARRIIMHRVGDRLIPVGYTSSRNPNPNLGQGNELGPILTTADEEIAASAGRRRGSRRLGSGAVGGEVAPQDLEELMVMEAMRLSMLDHEEHQRKEAEAKKKKKDEEARKAANGGEGSSKFGLFGFKHHSPKIGDSSSTPEPSSSSPAPSSRRGSNPSPSPHPVANLSLISSETNESQARRSEALSEAQNENLDIPQRLERPDLINMESTDTIPVSNAVKHPHFAN